MGSDIEIIQDCLKGNQLAYKRLYEKYISYCYGICIRYAVNQSDIKDVVQVIFSQAFQALKNYDSERSQFKTWFTRVCINNILSYRKKQLKGFHTQQIDDDFDDDAGLYSENEIEHKIDKDYILSIIKKMPSNYQLVFNLFIIDGYTHEEISKELNITTVSSRVTLSRARNWVKKTFINQLST